MGGGNFNSSAWDNHLSSRGISSTSKADELFTNDHLADKLSPYNVLRESRDSVEHPNSTPIILGLDETGSMDAVLEVIVKKLKDLILGIYDRKPVTDPQIMVMGLGDHMSDKSPLQVSQFESDIRIAEQLQEIYFEQMGGGNGGESYSLAWYFAAKHTSIDSFEKHGRKGFIFTIGDEPCHASLSGRSLHRLCGDATEDVSSIDALREASEKYEVYHLIVPGWHMQHYADEVTTNWRSLLGERAIIVTDTEKIPEVIISILEVMAGKSKDEVIDSWDGSTSVVVKQAISGLTVSDESGLVEM